MNINEFKEFWQELLKPFCIIISAVLLITLCVVRCGLQMDFYDSKQRIESVRRDISKNSTEDLIGQATWWNQEIAAYKYWNGVPVVGFTIPDGWGDIESISIPHDRPIWEFFDGEIGDGYVDLDSEQPH